MQGTELTKIQSGKTATQFVKENRHFRLNTVKTVGFLQSNIWTFFHQSCIFLHSESYKILLICILFYYANSLSLIPLVFSFTSFLKKFRYFFTITSQVKFSRTYLLPFFPMIFASSSFFKRKFKHPSNSK